MTHRTALSIASSNYHYDGCWKDHRNCAVDRCRRYEKALREIDTISATTNMSDQALGNINEITTEALNG